MNPRPLVELLPAFVYTCDRCGKDAFTRSVAVEDPEIQAQAAATFREIIESTEGVDAALDWDGVVSTAPSTVVCPHCNTEYDVSVSGYDLETLGMFYDELYDDDDLEDFDDDFFDEDDFDDFDDDDDEDLDEDEEVEDF